MIRHQATYEPGVLSVSDLCNEFSAGKGLAFRLEQHLVDDDKGIVTSAVACHDLSVASLGDFGTLRNEGGGL